MAADATSRNPNSVTPQLASKGNQLVDPTKPVDWLGLIGVGNGYAGSGIGILENVAGKSRIGRTGVYLPSSSGRVFTGNQFTSTFGIKGIASGLGIASLGLGTFLDIRGVKIYKNEGANAEGAVNPGKAGINFGAGLWGLGIGGTVGATGGIYYWGVDTFYPGGWPAAMQMTSEHYKREKGILPVGSGIPIKPY